MKRWLPRFDVALSVVIGVAYAAMVAWVAIVAWYRGELLVLALGLFLGAAGVLLALPTWPPAWLVASAAPRIVELTGEVEAWRIAYRSACRRAEGTEARLRALNADDEVPCCDRGEVSSL